MVFNQRASWSDFVSIPRSGFALLLAASLFFTPLTSLRLTELISYCDVLFIAAVALGLFDFFRRGDFVRLPAWKLRVVGVYCLAGFLFILCYAVNALEDSVTGGLQQILGVPGKLPDKAKLLFGASVPQERLFFIFFVNAIGVPLVLLLMPSVRVPELRFLILVWTAGSLYGAAFTVAYCNGYIPSHYDWYWVKLGRATGLTPHANILALSSLLAVPGLLMLMTYFRNWWSWGIGFSGIGLVWLAIDYSGSRSAVLGFLVLPFVFLLLYHSRMLADVARVVWAAGLAILFAVVVGLALLVFGDGVGSGALARLKGGARSSDSARELINQMSWEQAFDSPVFGTGYQVLRVAHNLYLQIFHAAGLVGLVAYVCVMLAPAVILYHLGKTEKQFFGITAALLAAMMVLVVLSAYKASISDLSTSIVFGLVLYAAGVINVNNRLPSQLDSRAKVFPSEALPRRELN